jgi:hypothetical protein
MVKQHCPKGATVAEREKIAQEYLAKCYPAGIIQVALAPLEGMNLIKDQALMARAQSA